jgi:hypothetical protein
MMRMDYWVSDDESVVVSVVASQVVSFDEALCFDDDSFFDLAEACDFVVTGLSASWNE